MLNWSSWYSSSYCSIKSNYNGQASDLHYICLITLFGSRKSLLLTEVLKVELFFGSRDVDYTFKNQLYTEGIPLTCECPVTTMSEWRQMERMSF